MRTRGDLGGMRPWSFRAQSSCARAAVRRCKHVVSPIFRITSRGAPWCAFIAALLPAIPARAALPQYDHIVIVIEENRSYGDIIGNVANAPFMNALATQGVAFSNYFAVAHPSQANYLHLFCGSGMGVTTD